jgi:hypothetical protein
MSNDTNILGPQINTTRGQQFIPEIWLKEILVFKRQALLDKSILRTWESEVSKGDTFHIPRISELGVEDKASDHAVSLQNVGDSPYSISVDTDRTTAVAIDIMLEMQSAYELRSPYSQAMGYALARDFSASILGLRAAVNNNAASSIFCSSNGLATGNGTAITFAAIMAARRNLLEADVIGDDQGGLNDCTLIVSPAQETAIMNMTQFISKDFINDPPLVRGFIGSLLGIPVVRTNIITVNSLTGWRNGALGAPEPTPGTLGSFYTPKQDPVTPLPLLFTGNSRPIQTAMLVHKDWAAGVVASSPKVTTSFENREQVNLWVARQAYGCKLYRPNHAILIHSTNDLV